MDSYNDNNIHQRYHQQSNFQITNVKYTKKVSSIMIDDFSSSGVVLELFKNRKKIVFRRFLILDDEILIFCVLTQVSDKDIRSSRRCLFHL